MSLRTIALVIIVAALVGAVAYYIGTQRAPSGSASAADDHAGATTHPAQIDRSLLAGQWRSIEDPKFVRIFDTGHVTDIYNDDPSTMQTAPFAYVESAPGIPNDATAGKTLIKVSYDDGPMYFAIDTLTENSLTMTNLSGRGNILSFTRDR